VEGPTQPKYSAQGRGKPQGSYNLYAESAVVLLVVIVIGVLFLVPISPAPHSHSSPCLQESHILGDALYAYANDHRGNYPEGTSSTEIFQQLLDQGYITDASILYVAMDGKTEAAVGQKELKPENVSWDVTGGVNANDSGHLPLLFLTGFRVTYAPNGGIEPIIKPYPPYRDFGSGSGLAVFFKDNSTAWVMPTDSGLGYSMAHLLPSNFDAHGKTCRQLTPDGALK
jgi:hypothetical protein